MKKKTKANLEKQSDSQDQEIQDSTSIEQKYQATITTLCNPGEACYQILVKLQELMEVLKQANQIQAERNSIISENPDEEPSEEAEPDEEELDEEAEDEEQSEED